MRIIFIRHGESEGNVIHEINDDPRRIVNLTSRGRVQAEAAAGQLRGVPFTCAYASEFMRARHCRISCCAIVRWNFMLTRA